MEVSEQRHSAETKETIERLVQKLDDHIVDDITIQTQLRGDVRSLLETRSNNTSVRNTRHAWLVALSGLAGATMLKLLDRLWPPHL